MSRHATSSSLPSLSLRAVPRFPPWRFRIEGPVDSLGAQEQTCVSSSQGPPGRGSIPEPLSKEADLAGIFRAAPPQVALVLPKVPRGLLHGPGNRGRRSHSRTRKIRSEPGRACAGEAPGLLEEGWVGATPGARTSLGSSACSGRGWLSRSPGEPLRLPAPYFHVVAARAALAQPKSWQRYAI